MNEMDLKLYEFVRELRLQAEEYERMAVDNEKHRPSFSIKMCGMMEAYRDIADKMEQEFRDKW